MTGLYKCPPPDPATVAARASQGECLGMAHRRPVHCLSVNDYAKLECTRMRDGGHAKFSSVTRYARRFTVCPTTVMPGSQISACTGATWQRNGKSMAFSDALEFS
eukprot:4962563-Amphidinium_carterae.1